MEIRMQTVDWGDQVTLASEKQVGEGEKLNTFSSSSSSSSSDDDDDEEKWHQSVLCHLDVHKQTRPGMNARALLC